MTIQEIQRLRNEHPFRPFRILTADGKAYDVLHPEFMGQTPSGRFITIGLPDDSSVMLDLQTRGALFAFDLPIGYDFQAMSEVLRAELPPGTLTYWIPRGLPPPSAMPLTGVTSP